jgi:peptide/nickel transport system substrate-binding protein
MSAGRRVTRRDFLKQSAGLATLGVLAACGPRAVEETTPSPVGGTPSPTPRVTKTLRYVMSGRMTSADTADPHLSNTTHDGRLAAMVYEALTGYDESLKPVPWLAESWAPNEAGDEWTFTLREGVTFHDASPLTPADVVYSFRRILDPATKSAAAGVLTFLDPDGIEAVDNRTVRFKLKERVADLPGSLITKQSFIVKEGATGDELRTRANGTGPFRLEKFTPGQGPTIFVRNEKYWQPGSPKVDVVELSAIIEPASRVAALERGQVDIIEDPPGTDLPRLESGPDTAVVVERKGLGTHMAMMIDVPPFDDNRVRLAMKYVMDRDQMIQLVAQGYATPLNDIPVAPFVQYGLPGPPRPRDLEKARALLAEAGYADGLEVKLATSDIEPRFIETATAYKAMAAEAGINVEVDVRPADTYWDEVWLKEPFVLTDWLARPTEAMLALVLLSNAAWNETHWRRPDWDKRFFEARRTLDEAKRTALFHELQQEVVDEGGYLSPYMANTVRGIRKAVTGFKPTGDIFVANWAFIDVAV